MSTDNPGYRYQDWRLILTDAKYYLIKQIGSRRKGESETFSVVARIVLAIPEVEADELMAAFRG